MLVTYSWVSVYGSVGVVVGVWETWGNQSGCWSTKCCHDVLGRRVWLGRRQSWWECV